jgi:hypothetical protein
MRIPMAAWLIALMGVASGAQAQTPVFAPAKQSARYVYCNVYMSDACFGIASGDTLTMEIPVDFVLDTIRLWNGVQVVIYEGNHPQDVFAGKAVRSCSSASQAHQCRYTKTDSQWDIVYQAAASSQMIHLRITGVKPDNQAGVAGFLSGFRRCHAIGQSEQCTDERIFSGID